MRTLSALAVIALTVALAAALAGAAPAVRSRTYFITGVKDADDVAAIIAAIRTQPSVTEVSGLTPESGTVAVVFDTHAISHGQVGYAIMGARPGHDYGVSMRLRVPQYAQGENARAVDAVMTRQSKLAAIRLLDREKGLFEVKILPFTPDAARSGPQGFHCGNLLHPIHDPAPKGLGLEFQFIGAGGKPDPLE